jgi:hypothetical protein
MTYRAILLLSLALPLAACGSEPEVDIKNASVGEVAREVAESGSDGAFVMRPGKWASKVRIEEVKVPGMPPEAAKQMQDMFAARQQGSESCLTAEQAKRPSEDFFSGKSDQCRYDHFKMGDGKIDAKMRCQAGGATQIMEMTGNYSRDNYSMTMSMNQQGGPEAAAGLRMRMRVDAKRVGECTGEEA